MAMERENYRLNLEGVINAFPDEPFLSICAVGKYLGKDTRNLRSDKNFMKLCRKTGKRTNITRESLAHWMSGN